MSKLLYKWGLSPQKPAFRSYEQSPKGKTPVVPGTGKRFSLNLISAISNKGQMVFMILDGRFNAAAFINFLQKLLKSVSQKIFLIADRHPVHVQRKVTAWFKQRKERIEYIPLPTYAPELNVDEYFNQDLKTNGIGRQRPANKEELRLLAENFANSKKRNPEKIKNYFHHPAVIYAR